MFLCTMNPTVRDFEQPSLPPAHRRFLLASIRSALISRHPELQASMSTDTGGGLGVVEMQLERIAALAQRAIISGPPDDLGELLDDSVCPACVYKTLGADCELKCGGCLLRRYGATIFDAAKHALVKLAGQ